MSSISLVARAAVKAGATTTPLLTPPVGRTTVTFQISLADITSRTLDFTIDTWISRDAGATWAYCGGCGLALARSNCALVTGGMQMPADDHHPAPWVAASTDLTLTLTTPTTNQTRFKATLTNNEDFTTSVVAVVL